MPVVAAKCSTTGTTYLEGGRSGATTCSATAFLAAWALWSSTPRPPTGTAWPRFKVGRELEKGGELVERSERSSRKGVRWAGGEVLELEEGEELELE